MEKWINQTLTTGLVVTFGSLYTEELLQTKQFFEFMVTVKSNNPYHHIFLFLFFPYLPLVFRLFPPFLTFFFFLSFIYFHICKNAEKLKKV